MWVPGGALPCLQVYVCLFIHDKRPFYRVKSCLSDGKKLMCLLTMLLLRNLSFIGFLVFLHIFSGMLWCHVTSVTYVRKRTHEGCSDRTTHCVVLPIACPLYSTVCYPTLPTEYWSIMIRKSDPSVTGWLPAPTRVQLATPSFWQMSCLLISDGRIHMQYILSSHWHHACQVSDSRNYISPQRSCISL